jgi:PQQ-like domain
MKGAAGLAALAVITVAGLTPATALSPQRALAAAGARAVSAGVPRGTRLWTASYRDHSQQNSGQAVAASPDGSTVYITGSSGTDTGLAHITAVAYNAATGARRWVAHYYGLGVSGPSAMAISPDGSRLFIAGFTTPVGSAFPNRFTVVAFDARTGALLWARNPFSDGLATSVTVSPDSATVYATGIIGDQVDGLGTVATFAYDAATGARRWLARYHGQRPSSVSQSVAASPDGHSVFVTSPVNSSSGGRFLVTLAYDAATGATRWTRLANGTVETPEGFGTGRGIAVSPDSSAVFVTGSVPGASGASTLTTIAYATATGAPLWARQYQGPQPDNAGNAITVSPDGSRVFVTGHSNGIASPYAQNYATVAYAAATGAQQWARTFPSPSTPLAASLGAVSIGVSPDSTLVYVTGTTRALRPGTLNGNATTVAYETATGTVSWADRYRGRRDFSVATSLAVGPTGQAVFVTGSVGAHDGCCNFATIAYQP